jgi:membrane protein required for colicin V production
VNYVDIGVLVVIGLSALLALGRGLIKEILSMFGWVGAAIVTYLVFFQVPAVREFARKQIAEPLFADIATAVVVFTVSLIVLGIINHFVVSRIPTGFLGPLDKSLGLVFGLARGALIVAIAHILLVYVLPNRADWPPVVQEARTEPYAARAAEVLTGLIPADIKEQTDDLINQGTGAPTGATPLNANPLGNPPENGGNNGLDAAPDPSLESGQNSGEGGWPQGSNAGIAGGQGEGSGYKDAERKDLERLLQVQAQ